LLPIDFWITRASLEEEVFDMAMSLKEKLDAWDRGEYTFSPVEEALLKIPEGQHVSKEALELLGKCTICSVGNSSCLEFMEIIASGICPPKSGCSVLKKNIRICKLGCNAENCILNK